MGLNDKPSGERLHIAFFGMRNAGKSSVVNAVTGQALSLVSEHMGTTTDPVQKAMELLPIGPVVIIDTTGIDDEGDLGEMRVKRALRMLDKTDVAVLVVDAAAGMGEHDRVLMAEFEKRSIPYITVYNKSDLLEECPTTDGKSLYVSAKRKTNIRELKEMIGRLGGVREEKQLVGDLLSAGDIVVLVTPIDESAPKGRMILPQQQMIRDVLDGGAVNIVAKETEIADALSALKEKPRMVITDSQVFGTVSRIVPEDIPLTSFSILFARYKGELEEPVLGAAFLDRLCDGDRVLISEGCTHHRQCNDIGTVKLPGWIEKYTGKKLSYEFTSGGEFPAELEKYALIVHCGGCMLNEREMKSRIARARAAGVPFTNYGIAIAQMHGILQRALSPFPKFAKAFQKNRTGDDDRV